MDAGGLANIVCFGPFRLDLKAGEVCQDGERVRLQEQPYQILKMLLEQPGEVVTREEIRKKLWPNDTIVEFDHSINAAIKKLRLALGDTAESPRYVETVARRGYRLMVTAEWLRDNPAQPPVAGAPVATPREPGRSPSDLIGQTVSHYRVMGVVGSGGMGVVYRAEDIRLGRQVALKFSPDELAGDPKARERFEREARAASTLNHPNICTIHEVEEHEGTPFIVMELLEGQTLREHLVRPGLATASPTQEPPLIAAKGLALPIDELMALAIQIADGLDAAHQKGVIHRDIKPANIFITTNSQAKILDFGLAKVNQSLTPSPSPQGRGARGEGTLPTETPTASIDSKHLTRPDAMMGTAAYMSPEQIRGDKVDARTDLFSFGLVLYEMATGKPAFSGDTIATVHEAILHAAPAPASESNPHLPAKLEEIINKALEKDRNLRYQHASDIRTDFKRLKRETDSGGGRAIPVVSEPARQDTLAERGHEVVLSRAKDAPPTEREPGARLWHRMAAALATLVLGIAVILYLDHRVQPKPELLQRQLTANSSELAVFAAAISSDGRYLAYSDESGIYLKVIDTGETHALATPPGSTIYHLAWFPENNRLLASGVARRQRVFLDLDSPEPTGSLWAVSILGGAPRRLRDDAEGGSVLPDGSGIVFVNDNRTEIWQMGPGGEEARKLMTAAEGESFDNITVSESRLWYARYGTNNNYLESRSLKGGPPRILVSRIVSDVTGIAAVAERTPRRNRRLIYSLMDPSLGAGSIWEVEADPDGQVIGKPRQVAAWPDFVPIGLSATFDGSRLAFRKVRQVAGVYVGDLQENGLRVANLRRLTLSDSFDHAYSWTPDSRRVLFDSNRNGGWNVFQQGLDEGTAEQIVQTSGTAVRPVMTPDGLSVLYLEKAPDRPGASVMRAPLSGGPPQPLGDVNGADQIRCARTANVCVVGDWGPKQRIFYFLDPLKGRGHEFLRTSSGNNDQPGDWDLSPDGSDLAFTKYDPQKASLHIQIRPLAGGVRELNVSGWADSGQTRKTASWPVGAIRWAADGKGWYVTALAPLKVDLAGNAQPLLPGSTSGEAIPSPDGRHVAITGTVITSNVWMLENF